MSAELHAADFERFRLMNSEASMEFGHVAAPMGYSEFCATSELDCNLVSFMTRRAIMTPDRVLEPYLSREVTVSGLQPLDQDELHAVPEAASYPVAVNDCDAVLITSKCYLNSLPRSANWMFDTASLQKRDIGSPIYKRVGLLPRGGGFFQIGKPYKVAGLTFKPALDLGYDQTGTASWYGRQYHSRMTSNGEWFDMEYLTAAHPTLPLPSYAKVINLDNGKELIVRINDRGPFVADRLIDVSKKAAEILGFKEQGTATVRVQYIGPAPLNDHGSDLAAMNSDLARSEAIESTEQQRLRLLGTAAPVEVAEAGPIMNF